MCRELIKITIMEIIDYQIEMLSVGAADAFIIHFTTEEFSYNVLVDAGNYSDGNKIASHMAKWYPDEVVDLAIVTHPDKDHFGGFVRLLEKIKDDDDDKVDILEFWVNDPENGHVDKDEVKWITKQGTVNVKARSVFDLDNHDNLIDLIDELGIPRYEKFADSHKEGNTFVPNADGVFSCFYIIGPTKEYYESLIPDFRNDELNFFDKEDDTNYDENNDKGSTASLSKTLDEAKEDTSAHNQSSLIFVFQPSATMKYLFMGDAGVKAFSSMLNSGRTFAQNVSWLKVPHHGSKHNLNSAVIKHINPNVAYISTEKVGKYLNMCVVNAFKKIGTNVYSTHINKADFLHNGEREGYSTAKPL